MPAQYTPDKPACVLVFQDGQRATNPNGVAPHPAGHGQPDPQEGDAGHDRHLHHARASAARSTREVGGGNPNNRSVEYDSLGDKYARFIVDEMLPEVGKNYNLTKDPDGRAIGGTSSGAICAFTVAWERPDEFRKVISCIGSFTNIRGGHVYPDLVRKTDSKPIRIFIQDSSTTSPAPTTPTATGTCRTRRWSPP